MDVKLWEIKALIEDAADCLRDASRKAAEASGSDGGRAPAEWTERIDCPDCGGSGFGCVGCDSRGYFDVHHSDPGEPAVEGWPAMDAFADVLDKLAEQVASCIPPEIAEAIKAEEEDDDHLSDLADAASY